MKHLILLISLFTYNLIGQITPSIPLTEFISADLLIFSEDDKYGLKRIGNETVIYDNIFDTIYTSGRYGHMGADKYFITKLNNKFQFINNAGEWFPKINFDQIKHFSSKTCFAGYLNDTIYFLNTYGEIITTEYKEITISGDGAFAKKNDLLGYIDCNNNILIDFQYETLKRFSNGRCYAQKKGFMGIIDERDSIIVPFIFKQIVPTLNDLDGTGKEYIVQKDSKLGSIYLDDIDFEWTYIIPLVYDKISGWCCGKLVSGHYVENNNLQGYITDRGDTIIPLLYDGVSISIGGKFTVLKDEKIGIVNHKNEIIIPIENDYIFTNAEQFIFNYQDTLDDKFVILKDSIWSYSTLQGKLLKENVNPKDIDKDINYPILEYYESNTVSGSCLIKVIDK